MMDVSIVLQMLMVLFNQNLIKHAYVAVQITGRNALLHLNVPLTRCPMTMQSQNARNLATDFVLNKNYSAKSVAALEEVVTVMKFGHPLNRQVYTKLPLIIEN